MTADDARRTEAHLDDLIQGYVDGTLADKEALRVNLRAQADVTLEARVDETRRFFAALDTMPRDEPASDFDAAVLASVPLERYRSAPRRHTPVIVVGDFAPSRLARTVRSFGRLALAGSAAYLLTLGLVGVTALAVGGGVGLAVLVALTAQRRRRTAAGALR